MNFVRGVFILAIVTFFAGVVGSQYLFQSIFALPANSSGVPVVANVPVANITPVAAPAGSVSARPTKIAARTVGATPTPSRSSASSTVTPLPAPTPRKGPTATATISATSTVTATKTPVATPTSTQTSGTVTLANYWVATPHARRGQTIAVGFIINNGSGHTLHLMLGASIKSDRVQSWAYSLSDPAHDVVAVVPPGMSTHIRYFTLPSALKAGAYDVAWGLRHAGSGRRAALVAADAVLRVSG
jgi:hypothetical protein